MHKESLYTGTLGTWCSILTRAMCHILSVILPPQGPSSSARWLSDDRGPEVSGHCPDPRDRQRVREGPGGAVKAVLGEDERQ